MQLESPTKQLKTFVREVKELKSRSNDPDKSLLTVLLLLGTKYLENKQVIKSNLDSDDLANEFNDIILRARILLGDSKNSFLTDISPQQLNNQYPFIETLSTLLDSSPVLKKRISLLADTYQTWQSDHRYLALQNIQKANKKISTDELISFTQIYTPEWVVEFLLSNTIGGCANGARANQWKLPDSPGSSEDLEKIKILDPACGSGNFLVGAYQYLSTFYESKGISKSDSFNRIIENQLFGADIDARALSVVSLTFAVLSKEAAVLPTVHFKNLVHLDVANAGELGSLNKELPEDHILNTKYDIVVTNPPYIGRKLLNRSLKASLKTNYPHSCSDLSAAFVERSLALLNQGGKFGVITQASLLALPTYRKLRSFILENYNVNLVVELGPGVFPTQNGEKINSALLVFEKGTTNDTDSLISLIDLKNTKDKKESLKQEVERVQAGELKENGIFHVLEKESISNLHNRSFNCMMPDKILEFIKHGRKLSQIAAVKQGLATTDNKKFVKYLWEINPHEFNRIWFPYAKGSGNSKWYAPVTHVVDWEDEGKRIKDSVRAKYPYLKGKVNWVVKNEHYYFKSGISFSFVNSKGLAFRLLPSNCIFDVGASSVFPESLDKQYLLGYLNSSFVSAFVGSINPTINNQVGDIKQIPIILPSIEKQDQIKEKSRGCYQLSKQLFQLTNPLSFYINRFYESEESEIKNQFINQFCCDDLSIEEVFKLYTSEVNRITNQIKLLQTNLDDIVKETIIENLNLNNGQEQKILNWIDGFNRTSVNSSTPFDKKSFLNRYLLNKRLFEQFNRENQSHQTFSKAEISRFLDSDLNRYLKTDLRSFIGSLYCGQVPECLSLDDIENLLK